MIQLGQIEVKKNAVERSGGCSGGLYDGMRHMLDVVLIRHSKGFGEIRVMEADGELGSQWTDGHSWPYIRKVWKSLKENHDNSLDR